jgi:hypothetical protein
MPESEEPKVPVSVERTEREKGIKSLADFLYTALRGIAPMGREQLDQLRKNGKLLYEAVAEIADHRAKVICGQFAMQVNEEIASLRKILEDLAQEKPVKSSKGKPDNVSNVP